MNMYDDVRKIFICQSGPIDMTRLNPGGEVSKIINAFEKSVNKKYVVKTEQLPIGDNLEKYLLDEKPEIFHFTGHGRIYQETAKSEEESTLYFVDKDQYAQEICADVICNIFKRTKTIQCVVLNACDSYLLANKLAAFIPTVIGMKGKPSDKSAIAFAEGFYNAIARGLTYKEAFDSGVNLIKCRDGNDYDCPYLANVDFDPEVIVEDILNNECVLFIGPDLANGKGSPYEKLFDSLQNEYIKRHKNDNLLIFNETSADIKNEKIYVEQKIKSFVRENVFFRTELERIAEIPFHLIISAMPDKSLEKIMNERQYEYSFITHKNYKQTLPEPLSEKPLIYHILGSFDPNSKPIITHFDLFKYIENVVKGETIPYQFKNIFIDRSIKRLIFLGFQFDKWYFQLLLWMLNIHSSSTLKQSIYDKHDQLFDNDSTYLTKQMFNITLIDHNINLFIEKIYNIMKTKNKLRKSVVDNNNINTID